jgi:hypothetical protein
MNSPDTLQQDLIAHAELCRELLQLAADENRLLRADPGFKPAQHDARRKDLLPRLDASLHRLRAHRMAWQQLPSTERSRRPEIDQLIRATQELAMKLILIDRENEQALLRRGLVPPRHLPSAESRQPGHVVSMYLRHRN